MRSRIIPVSSTTPVYFRQFPVALCCLLLAQGCTVTPTSVRDSAASLSKNELQIDTGISPTLALNFAYGITDDVDIGIDVESVPGVWAKYSFAPAANGSQWALNAGAFSRTLNTVDEVNNNDSDVRINGVYLGAIFSQKFASGSSLNLAYRYNALKYDSFTISRDGWWGISQDNGFLNYDDRSTVNISSNDLAGIGTLSATWSMLWKPQAHIHFGASCQLYHSNNNRAVESTFCTPVLGLAFFRR